MLRLALYSPLLSPFGTRECHKIQPYIRVKGRCTALSRFAVPLLPRPRILTPVTGVAMFNAVKHLSNSLAGWRSHSACQPLQVISNHPY